MINLSHYIRSANQVKHVQELLQRVLSYLVLVQHDHDSCSRVPVPVGYIFEFIVIEVKIARGTEEFRRR